MSKVVRESWELKRKKDGGKVAESQIRKFDYGEKGCHGTSFPTKKSKNIWFRQMVFCRIDTGVTDSGDTHG